MKRIKIVYRKIINDTTNFINGFLCLYSFIKRKRNDEVDVFLTDSIGDDIYALSLMNQFKKSVSGHLTLFCDKKRELLAKAYKEIFDELVLLDNNSRDYKLIMAYHRNKYAIGIGQKRNIYSVMPYHVYPIRKNLTENNLELIGKKLLLIQGELEIKFPDFSKLIIGNISRFKIKKNTIILNFGSKSMCNYSEDVFIRIAEDLFKRGYDLYSNVIEGQMPIKYTKALHCSIFEFYELCRNVKAVISIRSGILDFIAGLETPLMVMYFPLPAIYGHKEKTEKFFNRFTMRAWGRKNTYEFIYESDDQMFENYQKFLLKHFETNE